MRKSLKRTIAIMAATLTASALALTACGSNFKHPTGMPETDATVLSNGGFAVQKGDYVYFINGVETNESDNTYGDVVKGALMRIKTEDLDKKENKAEIVIPSLMVAQDYSSGIYIYGDRVYYATPNNVGNTSGEVDRNYLDFKSAKLDGSDIRSYFNVSSASTVYRYVEAEGTVYLLYNQSSTLHSYNTEKKEDTVLVKGMKEYVLNSTDKGDPWVYYVMAVTEDIDTDAPSAVNYTQIYRVRADATDIPEGYKYEYDPDYLEEHDGEEPYYNLGEIVLDGIGSMYAEAPTQFTHDMEEGVTPLSPDGYTYDLQAYENGGLYFLREDLTKTSSPGEAGWLYYLPVSELGENWNSITGNRESTGGTEGSLDVVALPENTSKANTSALFYVDETEEGARQHHYLYLSSAGNIHRADVRTDGTGTIENDMYGTVDGTGKNQVGTIVAYDVSGATLVSRDAESDETYDYLYFTRANGSGNSVERAVYNGGDRDYENLPYGDDDHAAYKPVKLFNLQHASGWYNYEIIEGRLFYADSEALGSTNYISYVSLRNEDGSLKNNVELKELNDEYEKMMGDDGVLAKLNSDGETSLSTALRYYFYTGETTLFDENVTEAIDAGKKDTALYTKDEQDRFHDFAEGKGDAEEIGDARTLAHFVTKIGQTSEDDVEAATEYWKNQLQRYVAPVSDDEGLEGWEIALIVVAACLVVAGGVVAAVLLLRKHKKDKKAAEAKPERLAVDTEDDKDIDVYAMNAPAEAEEELQEDPVEELEAPAEEAPAEEAEAPEEAPESPEEAPEAPEEGKPDEE